MFFKALWNAGSTASRPQVTDGSNRHGTVRVARNDSQKEKMIGQIENAANTTRYGVRNP